MEKFSTKFNDFLDNLKDEKNLSLIDTIKKGFNLIESLSTDDANPKKMGQPVYFSGISNLRQVLPLIFSGLN